jgi:hypothetical protein
VTVSPITASDRRFPFAAASHPDVWAPAISTAAMPRRCSPPMDAELPRPRSSRSRARGRRRSHRRSTGAVLRRRPGAPPAACEASRPPS